MAILDKWRALGCTGLLTLEACKGECSYAVTPGDYGLLAPAVQGPGVRHTAAGCLVPLQRACLRTSSLWRSRPSASC